MALTYGFYNSQNGDRVYDADQFSSFLDGIVYDGVYEAVGDKFYVTSLEDEDLTIQVGAGRAWLKHTWTLNDTNLYLNATAALDVYDRIDAVVLEVDKEIRTNSIKIIEGSPSDATPARPDLKNEDNIRQYPLAYIYREHGTTKIPNTHAGTLETDAESATECIKFMVGSSSMPLCSALALAGVPSGGKIGQVLAKSSSESGSVGWYDVAKLPHGDQWYIVNGIDDSNVVAAYKFKGRESLADALTNINYGTQYMLTVTGAVTWTTGKGLYFPATVDCYINNTELVNQKGSIVSCAFGYSGMSTGNVVTVGMYLGYAGNKQFYAKGGSYSSNTATYFNHVTGYAGATASTGSNSGVCYPSGVLATDWSTYGLWHDGLKLSVTKTTKTPYGDWTSGRVFTTCTSTNLARGTMYLSALVFYNCVLTDAQHVQLANQINAL